MRWSPCILWRHFDVVEVKKATLLLWVPVSISHGDSLWQLHLLSNDSSKQLRYQTGTDFFLDGFTTVAGAASWPWGKIHILLFIWFFIHSLHQDVIFVLYPLHSKATGFRFLSGFHCILCCFGQVTLTWGICFLLCKMGIVPGIKLQRLSYLILATNTMPSLFARCWGQTTWPAPWEICMQVKKQQLKLDMEQQTGSK